MICSEIVFMPCGALSAAGWKTTIRSEIVSMHPTGGTAELVLTRVLSPTA
jgi:hypothetical protein